MGFNSVEAVTLRSHSAGFLPSVRVRAPDRVKLSLKVEAQRPKSRKYEGFSSLQEEQLVKHFKQLCRRLVNCTQNGLPAFRELVQQSTN